MSTRARVAVIGGGIAGLTTALHLLQSGWDCQVYEAAPAPHPEGAGLHVAPNGVRVLRRLGVDLEPVATATRALAIRDWRRGGVVGLLPLTGRLDTPYYTLHRADLHRALLDRLPEHVVRYGARLTSLAEDDAGVAYTLADGTAHRAELLVGADGIHSAVRTRLCGDAPVYTGNIMYRGLLPAEACPDAVDPAHATIWAGPERHFVAYPVSGGRQYYFSASADHQPWESGDWSATVDPAFVAKHYEGWDDTVTAFLSRVPHMTQWALYDRPLSAGWPGRRTTLVGDAAHAMPPFLAQGANMAMEDAAVLVASLDRDPDPVAALRRYEAARQARVAAVHRLTADRGGTFRLPDGPAQRARDEALRAGSMRRDFDWIFEYDTETALG
ncbi:FAD-dependent oxidoreductase [Actinokineospora sp. 24-640]